MGTHLGRLIVLSVFGLLMVGRSAAGQTPSRQGALFEVDGTVLEPVQLEYDVTMSLQGRSMDLSAVRVLRSARSDQKRVWTVIDRTVLPNTTVTDSLVLDRSTLRPRLHHRFGPVPIRLTYTDSSAIGTVRVQGRSESIERYFNTPVLAGGANVRIALAAMPLGPDFRAELPVFNAQQHAVRTFTFEVTGIDSVETPAGTFETFVVSMGVSVGSAEGTLQVRRTSPHHVVRSTIEQTGAHGAPRTRIRTLTSREPIEAVTP